MKASEIYKQLAEEFNRRGMPSKFWSMLESLYNKAEAGHAMTVQEIKKETREEKLERVLRDILDHERMSVETSLYHRAKAALESE